MAKTNTNQKKDKQKTMSKKKEVRRKRSKKYEDILKEESEGKRIPLIGKPRLFKDPSDLLELFNLYLTSILEKVNVVENKKVAVFDKFKSNKEAISDNRQLDNIDIHGTLTEKELKEERKFKEIPSKLGFYVFLWGASKTTRSNLKKQEEFLETLETIDNYLEYQVEKAGSEGKIAPRIAEFILNTTYWRTPENSEKRTSDITINYKD